MTIAVPDGQALQTEVPSADDWAVEAHKIVQAYDDSKLGRRRIILDHIDFRLRRGDLCSVVGPSGCGKSTFLRLILGSEKPFAGALKIFGRPPGLPDRHRGIVYQRYSLFPHYTVLENVALGLELDETTPVQRMNRFWYARRHQMYLDRSRAYLERVGLAEHSDKFPHQLSGGQQQRVAIAQALITKPAILLMDEPFGALDPGTRERLQRWLLDIHAQDGTTIFFVTHDLEEAVFMSSRVVVLSQFWADKGQTREGARVVADLDVRTIKHDANLGPTLEQIRQVGFNKDKFRDIADFVYTHPDAVLPAELRK